MLSTAIILLRSVSVHLETAARSVRRYCPLLLAVSARQSKRMPSDANLEAAPDKFVHLLPQERRRPVFHSIRHLQAGREAGREAGGRAGGGGGGGGGGGRAGHAGIRAGKQAAGRTRLRPLCSTSQCLAAGGTRCGSSRASGSINNPHMLKPNAPLWLACLSRQLCAGPSVWQ